VPTLTRSIGETQRVHKGLYLDWPKDLVPEGALSDGQNVEPDLGLMRQVPGWSKYSTTAIPGVGPVMLIADYLNAAGTRKLLACSTTRLSQYNAGTNVFDDVTGGLQLLTGSSLFPIFYGVLNDLFIVTNGKDTLKQYNGTTWAALTGSPPSLLVGLDIYEGHVLGWNTGAVGFRTQWTDLNNPENWTTGEAGTLDIRDDNLAPILAGGKMGRQYLLYKEGARGGVYAMTYVGGSLIMQVERVIANLGVFCPKAVAVVGDVHFVLAADEQMYAVAPGAAPRPIGEPVRKRAFAGLNYAARNACWVAIHPAKKQVIFAIPQGASTTASRAYLYHWPTDSWGERELALQTGAWMRDPETTTIGDLAGTIGALVGTIGELSSDARDRFFVGGIGASAFVYTYGSSLLMDTAPVDAWVAGRWVGSGDGRMMRARGVEAEHSGGLAAEIGTAASIGSTMSYASLGNLAGGRADANASAQYLAPRFRTQGGATEAWELTGYRLDAYPRGRR
jgi:hypothetical protein